MDGTKINISGYFFTADIADKKQKELRVFGNRRVVVQAILELIRADDQKNIEYNLERLDTYVNQIERSLNSVNIDSDK